MRLKNSAEGSTTDINWQKKESADLKVGQLRLSKLRDGKKTEQSLRHLRGVIKQIKGAPGEEKQRE